MSKGFPGPDVGHIEGRQHGVAFGLFKRAVWDVEEPSDQKLEMNTEILEPIEVVTR